MKGKSHYSLELREKVALEAIESKNPIAVAEKYKIKISTVYSWVQLYKSKEKSHTKKTIKQLQAELEDKELENKILRELLKKTTQTLIKD